MPANDADSVSSAVAEERTATGAGRRCPRRAPRTAARSAPRASRDRLGLDHSPARRRPPRSSASVSSTSTSLRRSTIRSRSPSRRRTPRTPERRPRTPAGPGTRPRSARRGWPPFRRRRRRLLAKALQTASPRQAWRSSVGLLARLQRFHRLRLCSTASSCISCLPGRAIRSLPRRRRYRPARNGYRSADGAQLRGPSLPGRQGP